MIFPVHIFTVTSLAHGLVWWSLSLSLGLLSVYGSGPMDLWLIGGGSHVSCHLLAAALLQERMNSHKRWWENFFLCSLGSRGAAASFCYLQLHEWSYRSNNSSFLSKLLQILNCHLHYLMLYMTVTCSHFIQCWNLLWYRSE